MQKYPVLESLLSKWFHCIGVNYCHSLLIKLYLIAFNSLIAGATIYSWLLPMLERRYGFRASARVGKALI